MDVIYVRVCKLTCGTQSLPPKSILFILPILSSVWIPETEFSDNYLYLSGAPRRESGQAPYHHPEGRSISTPAALYQLPSHIHRLHRAISAPTVFYQLILCDSSNCATTTPAVQYTI